VAYAEKRGRGPAPWRVKYKLPSGGDASESGFETKTAALAGGRDQEARIREGRWTDPGAGKTTVDDWIDRWLVMQDVGISTQDNRAYLIRVFIRPAWGDSPLSSLTTEGITSWENALPALRTISPRTARAAQPPGPHPGRRGGGQAAADSLQRGAAAPQPRAPDRPPAGADAAADLGNPAADAPARRSGPRCCRAGTKT
jgi:hypothetical protein